MNYQLTYIVPTEISDIKELEKIIVAINNRIVELGGVMKKPISEIVESQFNENFRNNAEVKRIINDHKIDIFKHRLAYPIKHHRYGYYISVVFDLDIKNQDAVLKNLASELKHNKNILRVLISNYNMELLAEQMEKRGKLKTRGEAIEQEEAKKEEAAPAAEAEESADKEEKVLTEESKKSKIEDLDKKLEQILNA